MQGKMELESLDLLDLFIVYVRSPGIPPEPLYIHYISTRCMFAKSWQQFRCIVSQDYKSRNADKAFKITTNVLVVNQLV